ncbi:hypothetical protein EON83_13380 [bacterium]|nr:MAG: hypothetical protein EON83_13380 [bacterium]
MKLSPSRFRPLLSAVVRLVAPGLLVAFTVATVQVAHAWNAVGHMTIGAIAEARLNDHAKQEIAKLLPLVTDPRSPDLMTAGVWMDDIRADGVRLYDRWHYDNLGHSPDGTPIGPRHSDNVAWAVEQNLRALQSEKSSTEEKARALRFVLHTVEDAHNPLHCGSRFTKDNLKGDSGGNQFRLENVDSARNLHALWDGALGTFKRDDEDRLKSEERLRALATTLTTKYPEASFPQAAVLDPEKWIEEGTVYLKSDVYPQTATPDAAYMEHCRPIAEKQATLAGYRLARLLNSIWT